MYIDNAVSVSIFIALLLISGGGVLIGLNSLYARRYPAKDGNLIQVLLMSLVMLGWGVSGLLMAQDGGRTKFVSLILYSAAIPALLIGGGSFVAFCINVVSKLKEMIAAERRARQIEEAEKNLIPSGGSTSEEKIEKKWWNTAGSGRN